MRATKLKILLFSFFQSLLLGLIGLCCGILYSFGGLLIDGLVSLGMASSEYWSTPGLSYGSILAFGALVGMPLIFAAFGFLLGMVEAVLYNLLIAPYKKSIDLF